MSKIFIIAFSLAYSTYAVAANYGVELTVPSAAIYKNLTYSYDQVWSWGLAVETSPKIANSELAKAGMKWTLIDTREGSSIVPWQSFDANLPIFNIQLRDHSSIAALLPILKQILVVVAKSNGSPQYFLDLGKFCLQYPQKVSNMTDSTAAACEVNLPQNDACKEFGDYLSNLIKRGLLSCKVAEQKYSQGSPNFPAAINCGTRKFCAQ
jgi:hypothetical protein